MNLICKKIWTGIVISGLLIPGILFSSCSFRHAQGTHQDIQGKADQKDSAYFTLSEDTARSRLIADSLFIEAEKQKLQGNTEGAIRLFNDFLQLSPDNATAFYELALLNGKLKNAKATLSHAQRAVELDSSNHWFAIAYANALAMNKYYDSAARVFQRLFVRYPAQEEYLYNEAVMLSSAERYAEALQLFDRLEERVGINEEFVYQKQRIFLKMGKPDSAAREIQKLIDLNPENSRYYGLLAQVYADNNQPDKAIRVYQSLLDKYPDNPQAMVAMGLFYKNKGNDTAFKRYMAQAFGNPRFDIEDKIAFVYPYLKYVEIDSTKKEEALDLCRLIIHAHPNDPRAHALYGDMLFQCNIPNSALEEYRKTLDLDDSRYEVWNQMMLLYATEGNNDSLLSASGRAVELFSDQAGAWYFHGMALFFAGHFQQCILSLHRALQLEITDKNLKSRIYSTLGEAYHDLQNYESSDSCFQAALHITPEDDLVLNNYSYHLAERGQYLQQALQMIKTAVTLRPGQEMYEDTYAWVLFNLGKYESAKVWIEKVLSHPDAYNHPGYLEHYGDILFKNKDVHKAVQYWRMAKAKGGDAAMLDWKISRRKLPGPKRLLKYHNREK